MSTSHYSKYEAILPEATSPERTAESALAPPHSHASPLLSPYPMENGSQPRAPSKRSIKDDTSLRTNRPGRFLSWFEGTWTLDAMASFFSTAIIACIVALLAHYNGKRQPDWSRISLNTVVAVLGTIARGSIVLVTSRALGQTKWIWFTQKRRTLSELKSFDEASRGAFGSLQMLWSRMASSMVVLVGCLITIFSVAFDPFLQNLVRTTPQAVVALEQPALLANTSVYTAMGALQGASDFYVDPVMKANVYASLFNSDPLQSWSIPQLACNSGNCTWAPHDILAASYACNDVTSSLSKNCSWADDSGNCTIGLPGGPSLTSHFPDGGGKALALQVADSNVSSFGPLGKASRWAVLRSVTADINRTTDGAPAVAELFTNTTEYTATECIIFPCARQVSAALTNNTYTETYHTFHDPETNYDSDIWTYNIHNDWEPGQPYPMQVSLQPPPWPAGTNASNRSTLGMAEYPHRSIIGFMSVFSGNVVAASDYFRFNGTGSYASADVLQAIYYSSMSGCGNNTSALECAMNNTARAMTKTFRDSAYVANGQGRANMTTGETMIEVPVVQIQWVWLCLPLLVWALAIGFWITTAMVTWIHAVPLWMNNPLPLLFLYGERKDEVMAEDYSSTLATMYNRRARHLSARLERDGTIVRLQ